MRRVTFYFLIAFAVFGLGLSAFMLLNMPSIGEPAIVPPNDAGIAKVPYYDFSSNGRQTPVAISHISDAPARQEVHTSQDEANAKFTCSDKTILAVLDDIRRNKDLKNGLEIYLKEYPAADCKDMFRVEDKDLNMDGISESFVMATAYTLCGHGGNCSAWVVGQKGRSRKVILGPVSIEFMEVDKGRSEGYKNLSTYGEAGGDHHFLHLYRYRRDRYRVYKCFETTHDSQGDEHFRPLKLKEWNSL